MDESFFCQETTFTKELVNLIHDNVINITETSILDLYSFFRRCYAGNDSDIGLTKKSRQLMKNCPLADIVLSGIDFPSWFNTPLTKVKTIMIIGIDPLRNNKAFDLVSADTLNDVIIGTPFALHSPKMRNGRTKEYREFVNALAVNHFVYLTDIFKSCFYIGGERSYKYSFKNNLVINHLEVLKKEIQLIRPDLIITAWWFKLFSPSK